MRQLRAAIVAGTTAEFTAALYAGWRAEDEG